MTWGVEEQKDTYPLPDTYLPGGSTAHKPKPSSDLVQPPTSYGSAQPNYESHSSQSGSTPLGGEFLKPNAKELEEDERGRTHVEGTYERVSDQTYPTEPMTQLDEIVCNCGPQPNSCPAGPPG